MHSNTIIMGKKNRTRQQNNNDPNQPSTNEPSTNDVRLTRAMRRENRSNKKKEADASTIPDEDSGGRVTNRTKKNK